MLPNQEITAPDVSLKCLCQGDILLSGGEIQKGTKVTTMKHDDNDDNDDDNDGDYGLLLVGSVGSLGSRSWTQEI